MFPSHGDPQFQQRLSGLQEYQYFAVPAHNKVGTVNDYEIMTKNACTGFEKTLYQHLMQHYLSNRSPYRGMLLFHGLGVGKTCSSITIAEALLQDHSARIEPRVWVVLPSALQKSYEDQVFNTAKLLDTDYIRDQCMSDTYRKMVFGNNDTETLRKKIQNIIKTRYQMFTYEGFAKEAQKRNFKIDDKVIIVDEAHNLRIEETDKEAAQALMNVATTGNNNRIVLLSATPMYNEPDEIFWLLSILCANDKRKGLLKKLPSLYNAKNAPNVATFALLKQLCQEYVSYIKGTNPFTFAARLSPRDSGIPVYTSPEGWEKAIKHDLVDTECSPFQEECMSQMKKSDATLRQALNICYPSGQKAKVGEKGFFSIFQRETDGDPVQVSYISPRAKQLFPSDDKLGVIAPKLHRICNMIKQTEGIVIIYSQYIWSGVLPIAVALEHMGFKRHGARNILKNAEIIDPPVRYPGIPFPSYCILSGETSAMGNTKIEDLLKDINHPANTHGERIKVVIMSPVAGEGLSMKNVREVHIVDPWYHLNRIDQVIGRAFRTCHHNTLPVQERNVTVFLHVATSANQETNDINTYRIAARKATQTDEVENIIRDSALDCPLLKNVNYFPKDKFDFDVVMRTSRGVAVPYHFGDDISRAPQCLDPPSISDKSSIRKDVYKHLIPTGVQRLKKFLASRQTQLYFNIQELQDAINMHPDIVKSVVNTAIQEATVIGTRRFVMHKDGFVLKDLPSQPVARHIKFIKNVPVAPTDDSDREAIIAAQPIEDQDVGKLLIYKVIDSSCWDAFAKKIIGYEMDIPNSILGHVKLLHNEGAFVATKELPRHKNPRNVPFIGYVNLFDASKLSVVLYDFERHMFRDATDGEVEMLKRNRREVRKPEDNDNLYATVEPHKHSKKQGMASHNEVKLWLPGPTGRSRKGVVCESLKKNDTLQYIPGIDTNLTKEQVCFSLALDLLKKKRLFFLPIFKPT